MPYTYKKLKEGEFRVVILKPGNQDVTIELLIETLESQNNKDKAYDALSWQWGSNKSNTSGNTIFIKDQNDEPHLMLVRPNLLWALKRLRQLTQPRRLWVDFICINQTDPEERAEQVTKMTEIYSMAKSVHVWLGKPGYAVHSGAQDDFTDAELEIAVQHIDTLYNLDDANHISSVDIGMRNKADLHNLEPLFKLLKRGWFSRRWVVQEVGVARKVTVHCGDKQFSWEQLTHAVALLERVGRDGSIDRLFKLRPDTRHVSEYVGNISALPAYRLIQNVSGLYRQLSETRRIQQYTLEQLVCFLVISECPEPRDIIYSMLGIASDVRPVYEAHNPPDGDSQDAQTNSDPYNFRVRYEGEGVLQLYMRFLQYTIEKSRSLDILCRPWAPKMESKLPTRILNIERKPFLETAQKKMIRYNPDPFVGPAVRTKFYSASGDSINKDDWFEIDFESELIRVQVFELAKPLEILETAVHGSIPSSWFRCAKWDNPKDRPPQQFWRTLVADRTSAGLDPEPGYPSIIQASVREKGVKYGINTNEILHEKDNSAYYEVFRRVQAVVWNRRLIRAKLTKNDNTTDNDNEEKPLGLVPAETLPGDLIYIVDGCSVPLVLRTKEITPNRTQYQLVGECYIDNMMDGRAMEYNTGWKKIEIV
ncbi:heterokaryon incompatibility protein-domain-containing protein [Annulohypoxylon nitens]|nr:heterokaryon incompatibility protein-domain-containing protein [Annulohypoxylon nitens]